MPSRIAFQGQPGAYSHLACREAFPDLEPMPCQSFAAAFEAVEQGEAALALIPIENSLGGRVADMHLLLPDSTLYMTGEHFHAVHHCLLAPAGATLQSLATVKSHEQALAQCRIMLRELGLEPVRHNDTAEAAREVAERGDPSCGALASKLAAEIYGLEVLRTRVEDRLGANITRFVVMSRKRDEPDPRDGPCMTSFIFRVKSVPGALYKSLGGFATNGVNITKLESYITDTSFTVAQFYAEIEGHPAEVPVAQALDELQFFSTKLKVLGTFLQHPFRHTP